MIQQLSKVDQPRLAEWYNKAINDPTVRPFLSMNRYCQNVEDIGDSDWSKATFMDSANVGRLSLTMDRDNDVAGVSLFVLNNNVQVAASLIRYLFRVLPKRYGFNHIRCSISTSNVAWCKAVKKRFPSQNWGREPWGAWDSSKGVWVDVEHFLVHVDDFR